MGIPYEYIGTKPFFVDKHAGTGIIWRGKGDVQEIDPVFVPIFEKIYVNCVPLAGAQMKIVLTEAEQKVARKSKGDKTKVPVGTSYSSYSYNDLRLLFTQKTGAHPAKDASAVDMIQAIQAADVTAASLGEDITDEL
jgi:hypothetical protein